MRIEQLQAFLDVCETRSLNKSAKRLFISQPALSKSIQDLEKELKTDLFERTKTGIYLNKTGELFAHHAKKIIHEYEEALLTVSNSINSPKSINLCVCPMLATYFLPIILDALKAHFPKLKVNVNELSERNFSEISTYPQNTIVFMYAENSFEKSALNNYHSVEVLDMDRIAVYFNKDSHYAKYNTIPISLLSKDRSNQLYTQAFDTDFSDKVSISRNPDIIKNLISNQDYLFFIPEKFGNRVFENDANIITVPMDKPDACELLCIIPEPLSDECEPVAHMLKQLLLQYINQ